MILGQVKRRIYTTDPTPIERLDRLSQLLNGPTIYIKRDDLLGLTGGGNKTRKLEFLMADALENGADTIITCGALQSNHCRLTLAAAVKEGLHCQLVLEEGENQPFDPHANGNQLLFKLLGAEKLHTLEAGTDLLAKAEEVARQLETQGRKPYIIPIGGSNELGTLGYMRCAEEIVTQCNDAQLVFKDVIVASGSAGTHAGLALGFYRAHAPFHVKGINVSRPNETQQPKVEELLQKTAKSLEMENVPTNLIECFDDYVGGGYTVPTDEMIEAVQMLARTEGILLDAVYTGKVVAGLIDFIRKGKYTKEDAVLLVHTGGAPSLSAHSYLFQ
ncbi:D-cysteine desulfhydrase [Psychrobacillus sp. NPDC096623]|uniref:D-cysteine desulfhydrase n=1 Tax=Psychrobacillus sp. NPDC096623 TaxID=3364492 RepID=UPI0037F8AF00